jgi:hopanoid biosynthesis associated protein HpnK
MKPAQIELIVNGDDFGASKEANEAVIKAFREGILTSCSLMVSGDAFEHAVQLARENEKLAVGIHLVTVLGKSVLPHRLIPRLVDEQGNFSANPTIAGLKYYFSRPARRELRNELRAQFEKFASTGLKFSHIDSHLHMHVHPVVFHAAMELGEEFDVKRMRVPRDDFALARGFERNQPAGAFVQARVFGALCSRMEKALMRRGFTASQAVRGHFYSGRMSEEYVLFVLDRLKARTNEIYFHPAFYPDDSPLNERQRQSMRELRILTGNAVAQLIGARSIRLATYADLGKRHNPDEYHR